MGVGRSANGRRVLMVVLGFAAIGAAAYAWTHGLIGKTGGATSAQAQQERRVPVLVAPAVQKDMPLRLEALGTVEPLVTVAIRARVTSRVEQVLFEDGAAVKKGDVLLVLDAREVDAQIRQADATLAKDKVQLEKAQRDVERYSGLLARSAVSQVQLDDAKTTADMQKATVEQDEANLQNLRVQRTYYEIASPVTGRIGISGVRPGAVIRVDDTLATVRQFKPIYVTFGVPERYVGEVRAAMGKAEVDLRLQGSNDRIDGGRVVAIDNTIDPQTGTLMVRALFANDDERLWPGTLGDVSVTLRMEPDVIAIPAEAVQNGQNGAFVFVIEKGLAQVRPVSVARTVDGEAVITKGLSDGETVVTEGQLSLRAGSRVDVKSISPQRPAGS
ncbi:efflux RND transporter periplasmic adaptor subunit [Roseixanthobacter glucoisosaccharinicivorans]|uniref:efflux RND transporter periplasmic adaptor subunit n=1 Tax=Roseixanthobacter glucoisosaccharinicivorans TaxID=3119923 RepID=UPI00372B2ED7